jgi:acetyl esterase/lipase
VAALGQNEPCHSLRQHSRSTSGSVPAGTAVGASGLGQQRTCPLPSNRNIDVGYISELPTATCPMSHGLTAALTPARSKSPSLVARVMRICLRILVKRGLRANPSVEATRRHLRILGRLVPRPPRGTETIAIDAGGVPADRVATTASRHDRHILYLHGGGCDEVLRDDAVRIADKMRATGCHVEIEVWPHMWHVWYMCMRVMPEAKAAIARIAKFMDDKL